MLDYMDVLHPNDEVRLVTVRTMNPSFYSPHRDEMALNGTSETTILEVVYRTRRSPCLIFYLFLHVD